MRDACRAVTRCKKANRELAKAKAQGEQLDEPYAEVGFRSRKHPKQGCYIGVTQLRELWLGMG